MNKFTSIESFRHAIKKVRRYYDKIDKPYPTVKYTGTVKLHGTNAAIRRSESGKIQPQGRNRILSIDSDNYGFAFFVQSHMNAVEQLFNHFNSDDDVTVYGEWCGSGIQKNVALSQLDKHFVIFAIMLNGKYVDNFVELQDNENNIWNILQIPQYEIEIDFLNPTPASEVLSDLTLEVENECPWGKFRGVSGIGEGIVWVNDGDISISDMWFKTKGIKHKNAGEKSKKQKIMVDFKKQSSINDLVEEILPLWRLEQGISFLKENGLALFPESTGEYLRWIAKDILKEEINSIEASGFGWKDIQSTVMRKARQYYLKEIENVI